MVALYGKPYIEAAKDTWRLFKDRGIDALINDSLVGMSTFGLLEVLSPDAATDEPYYSLDMGCIRDRPALLAVRVPLPSL